jgi:hypothetical protein
MLAAQGFAVTGEQVNIRPPRRLTKEDKTKKWHQDDNQDHERPTKGLLLILWSNKTPTLVRDRATKQPFEGAVNGDVLLIPNDDCEHRMPEDGHKRWLAIGLVPITT